MHAANADPDELARRASADAAMDPAARASTLERQQANLAEVPAT